MTLVLILTGRDLRMPGVCQSVTDKALLVGWLIH